MRVRQLIYGKHLAHSRPSENVSVLPTGKKHERAVGMMKVFYEDIKTGIAPPI